MKMEWPVISLKLHWIVFVSSYYTSFCSNCNYLVICPIYRLYFDRSDKVWNLKLRNYKKKIDQLVITCGTKGHDLKLEKCPKVYGLQGSLCVCYVSGDSRHCLTLKCELGCTTIESLKVQGKDCASWLFDPGSRGIGVTEGFKFTTRVQII